MIKNRRIGTLTAGISMVVFGVLFLLRLAIPAITIHLIVSLWPIVLIFLGSEIIIAYVCNKEGQMKYDAGSVIIIIVLGMFSISMAAAQLFIDNSAHFL